MSCWCLLVFNMASRSLAGEIDGESLTPGRSVRSIKPKQDVKILMGWFWCHHFDMLEACLAGIPKP